MISEVEKIKQGLVEKTVEFDTQRKVIGVSTTNLLPNENGIVPLSKQGAFEPVETIDFSDAVNQNAPQEEIIEQLDLPVLDSTPQAGTLPEPVHNDVLTGSPVSVENPQDLSGFKIPEPVIEEEPSVMEPVAPAAIDIQMPEMPETVVANEPETMDANIFETPLQEETPVLTQSEEILNSIPSTTPVNEQPPMFESVTETPVMENVNIEIPLIEEDTATPLEEVVQPVVEPISEEVVEEPTIEQPETEIPIQEPISEPGTELEPIQEENLPSLNNEKAEEKSNEINQNAIFEEYRKLVDPILAKYTTAIQEAANIFNERLKEIEQEKNKELEETYAKINNQSNVINEQVSVQEQIQETRAQMVPPVNNMLNTGNNLVDDAISRINAIPQQGPRL